MLDGQEFCPRKDWLNHVLTLPIVYIIASRYLSYVRLANRPMCPHLCNANGRELISLHIHELAWCTCMGYYDHCVGAHGLTSMATDVSMTRPTLSLVDRTVTQDQGAWVIDYRLRHTGKTGVIITPEEIAVKVEGWVSNSRVASHAVPRWSSLVIAHGPDLSAMSEVISAADEGHRCRERLVVSVWTEDQDLWCKRPRRTACCQGSKSGQASAPLAGRDLKPDYH